MGKLKDDTLVIRGLFPMSAESTAPHDFEAPKFLDLEIYHPASERRFKVMIVTPKEDEVAVFTVEDGCSMDDSGAPHIGTLDSGLKYAIDDIFCFLTEPIGYYSNEWKQAHARRAGAVES